MADYVLLRSPAYFTKSAPVGGSVKLEIKDSNGFVLYEIIKNRRTNSFINFEYSELVRDYVGIYLYDNNEKLVDNVEFELVGTSYTGVNGTGTVVSTTSVDKIGLDGYGYFEDGRNPEVTKGCLLSNKVIYKLVDSEISIPYATENTTSVAFLYKGEIVHSQVGSMVKFSGVDYVSNTGYTSQSFKDRIESASSFSYPEAVYEENECVKQFLDEYELYEVDEVRIGTTEGLETIKVITVDECKYEPKKVVFINRWGAFQDLWFFKKSDETLGTTREQFKKSNTNGFYGTNEHQNVAFNVKSTKKITLNTGYVSEEYNAPMQELLQSELVWMRVDGKNIPMNVESKNLKFKTSVNDKLVDYTIELSYSFDAINNIR